MPTRPLAALALAAALTTALVASAPPARACGGLFCSVPQGPVPPEPVDQSAERILFVVNDDGTLTAHVQIQYAGGASSFAWVVPVPSVAIVEESSAAVVGAFDATTAPTVTLPQPEPCAFANSAPQSNACGGCGASDAAGGALAAPRTPEDGESPVTVYAHDFTDNYEYTVLGADDTATLVTWLQDNGYNVSSNMTPVMDPYNQPGAKFLALKLRDGKDASDIVPIAMTFEGTEPMVPIRLTRVAAQPLMGIQITILARTPFRPKPPYTSALLDADDLTFGGDGATNYFAVVARRAAEAQGRFFSQEFVDTVFMDFDRLHLDGSPRVVSRWYTRMSPEDMTADPEFVADDAFPLGRLRLDFSARTTLWDCSAANVLTDRLPSPCAFEYCGRDATCAELDGAAACACPTGHVAQGIRGPDGAPRVTCVPATNPVGVTDAAGGAGTAFDPCASFACGAGTCVLRGGFPTCACDLGAVAAYAPGGAVTCTVPTGTPRTFGPGGGAESAGLVLPRFARPSRTAAPWLFPLFALAFVLGSAWSWRRGAQQRTPPAP
ncbi:MAG: DUF2330 domain-containing protein [Deltaproteobacteria bacterium]|nr:DUF2330 domain-containing protein [Deltaproteobacteria bacterium]